DQFALLRDVRGGEPWIATQQIAEETEITHLLGGGGEHVRVDTEVSASHGDRSHPHRALLGEGITEVLTLKAEAVETSARLREHAIGVQDHQVDDPLAL